MSRSSTPRPWPAPGRIAAGLLLSILFGGCSNGPSSQLQQCRSENAQLRERVASELQVRRQTELEMRRLADRLAESEKELARNFDSSLAERPDRRRMPADDGRLVVPPPTSDSASTDLSRPPGRGTLGADGWRPSRSQP